jgi:hypothetical protein
VAVALAACSTEKRCPPNQPAFHFELTAADGVIPEDTALTVKYEGFLTEHYSLTKGGPKNHDLCCTPGQAVRGALPYVPCVPAHMREASVPAATSDPAAPPMPDTVVDASLDAAVRPSGPTAIHCSIWTDNVVDVQVTAGTYAPYSRPFEAHVPDPRCGVETIDVRVTLYHPEAGR